MDALATESLAPALEPLPRDDAVATSSPSDSADAPRAIGPDEAEPRFVARVPIAFARRFGVLGLRSDNGVMPVAIASRDSLHALSKISTLLGVPTQSVFVEESALRRAIHQAYGQQETNAEAVVADLGEESAETLLDSMTSSPDLLDSAGASPVTKLVNLILLEAVKRRASDVHVQPFEDRLQIRLRIDGVLYDYLQPPRRLHEEITSRIKVMGKMNIAEKRLPQDGRTTVTVGDKSVDLRISSLPTHFGERVVLRLLDKSARLYRLSELGMSTRDQAHFRTLIQRTHGIVLVTGPTGSGKTTTLYAALQELDCKELNIVTLEDPIEYQLPGISQSQTHDKKGMTFATGLRTVLRQDPDVIMVGEIRDQETARMAIQSSLTGHLVFSTLHTNDAPGAVARLLDLGVEPYLVAGSVLGVLAQRLVRRVCDACARHRPITDADRALLGASNASRTEVIPEAVGCERCHQTGYRDRVGVFELLLVGDELQGLITTHPQSKEVKSSARRGGMTTLREDAVRKALAGETTIEEVLRATNADEDRMMNAE